MPKVLIRVCYFVNQYNYFLKFIKLIWDGQQQCSTLELCLTIANMKIEI